MKQIVQELIKKHGWKVIAFIQNVKLPLQRFIKIDDVESIKELINLVVVNKEFNYLSFINS